MWQVLKIGMQKTTIIIFAVLLILAALVGGALLELFHFAGTPGSSKTIEQIVMVPSGQGLKATAADLYDRGIIRNAFKFNLYARIKGYDKKIKAGEYRVKPSNSPREILEIMVSGKVRLYKITIPEGYNLVQIAHMMPGAGLGSTGEFLAAAKNKDLAGEQNIPGDSFEGYLFPDTYHYPKGVSPEKIIQTMVRRFQEVFKPAWKVRARERKMTVHQVVTLASIIEKEAVLDIERPIISAVFHNRLKKRMKLQADPTVLYGVRKSEKRIRYRDLKRETPYNTYVIRGLPPGPIASPGVKSIRAALYPDDVDFLFFVSKNDGTHQFSKTNREHARAVALYQLNGRGKK
jgi:UPF0755 protein